MTNVLIKILISEVFLFTDMQRLNSLKSQNEIGNPISGFSQSHSAKDQHIIEEYEKLLNSKKNEQKTKLKHLASLSRCLLSVSITISRILYQFGNDPIEEDPGQQNLKDSLKLIFGKLEKCLTFLSSDKTNKVAERLAEVEGDFNDSIIIEKDNIEPPEWLRLKISKYKSQETFEA